MISTRARIIGILLLLAALATAAGSYAFLPEQVPVHWNAQGTVDGWAGKTVGALALPATMLAMFLVFQVIGFISPRGFRLDRFSGVVGIMQNALLAFLLLIYAAQIAAALGLPDVMETTVLAGNGILFVIIGNYLGKTRKNFFIGIRTPWTLASEEVWLKTHRLAGWLFVLAGIVLLLSAPFGVNAPLLIGAGLTAGLVPVLYSLLLYHRLEGLGRRASNDTEE